MTVTKTIPLALLMLTTALAGCAASPEEDDPAEAQSEALRIAPGGSGVKSKGDLEGDGYKCTTWPGTTVTECTKFGAPTYTCDSAGRCSVLSTAPPPPPPPRPLPPIVSTDRVLSP